MKFHTTTTAALFVFMSHAIGAPPPEHPSAEEANRLLGLHANRQTTLPNTGRVVSAIHANQYTYLEVDRGNGSTEWLAAPRTDVAVGRTIDWGEGLIMRSFHSKVLQRTFPEVLFVAGVRTRPENI